MSDQKLRLQVFLSAVDKITAPLKRVSTAGTATTAKIKDLRDKLSQLNKTTGQIDSYRTVSEQLAKSGHTLKEAKDHAKALSLQLKATEAPSNALRKLFEAARKEAQQLSNKHQELHAKQQRLRASLAASGILTSKLASHQRALKAATSEASAALTQQEDRLKRINEQMRQAARLRAQYGKANELRNKMAGNGAAMLGTGLVAGHAMMAPVGAYASAEDAGTGLRVALMKSDGKVGEEFARINTLAQQLGDRLPGTTADFQNMMTMLIRQGISAEAVLGGLGKATAYLGVQLNMPMEQAAEFAAKLQDATRTSEADMLNLMDTIQRTFYLGVDSGNMLQGFAKLSPAMDTIRLKGLAGAKALAPLLVMADQAGMAGESAGNAYRKVLQMGLDEGKVAKANKGLSKHGIKLDFTDGKGEFGGLDKLFAQMEKLKHLSTQARQSAISTLYGDDAETLQVVSLLIEKGAAGYAEVQAKMAAQATLQQRVNEQLGTLKNLWDAASGTFTNAMVAFGEAIAPELKVLVQWLGDMSERVGAWAKANPQLSNALMKTAAVVAALLTAVGALGLALAAVLGPLALARLSVGLLGVKMGGWLRILGMLSGALKWFGGALLKLGTVARVVSTFLVGMLGKALSLLGAAIKFLGVMLLRLLW